MQNRGIVGIAQCSQWIVKTTPKICIFVVLQAYPCFLDSLGAVIGLPLIVEVLCRAQATRLLEVSSYSNPS